MTVTMNSGDNEGQEWWMAVTNSGKNTRTSTLTTNMKQWGCFFLFLFFILQLHPTAARNCLWGVYVFILFYIHN
jgi:hypothetical protein